MHFTQGEQPTFVFVHGASCNGSIWGPLQRELALSGQRSIAVDLPGHGVHARRPASYFQNPPDLAAFAAEPSAQTGAGLAECVAHVVEVLRRVRERGPVVLVGTSGGGATLNGVGNTAPDLVDRLVYVSGWCCAKITTIVEGFQWPEHADNLFDAVPFPHLVDPLERGYARTDIRSADPEFFTKFKAATLADATDEEFRALVDLLEPDVNIALGQENCQVRPESWGSIPRSYVRLTGDRSIPVAVQDRMIAEADELMPEHAFDVHSVDTSHVGYFHRPEEFAHLFDRLAATVRDQDRQV